MKKNKEDILFSINKNDLLYNGEFENTIFNSIKKCFSNIKNINLFFKISKKYIVHVTYNNGVFTSIMNNDIIYHLNINDMINKILYLFQFYDVNKFLSSFEFKRNSNEDFVYLKNNIYKDSFPTIYSPFNLNELKIISSDMNDCLALSGNFDSFIFDVKKIISDINTLCGFSYQYKQNIIIFIDDDYYIREPYVIEIKYNNNKDGIEFYIMHENKIYDFSNEIGQSVNYINKNFYEELFNEKKQ